MDVPGEDTGFDGTADVPTFDTGSDDSGRDGAVGDASIDGSSHDASEDSAVDATGADSGPNCAALCPPETPACREASIDSDGHVTMSHESGLVNVVICAQQCGAVAECSTSITVIQGGPLIQYRVDDPLISANGCYRLVISSEHGDETAIDAVCNRTASGF